MHRIHLVVLLMIIASPATALPPLPEARSNNAVVALERRDGTYLFSALGLAEGRSWSDTRSDAWLLPPGSDSWRRLPDVPGDAGRLAGVAASAAGRIYVFGGYTVAEDGGERSVETVHSIAPRESAWRRHTDMPVPVDDAVALVHQDRIYLISGWHDLGNVNLVQVYDTRTDTWEQATPWPGPAVFGHAGGIVDGGLVVCDGVQVLPQDAVGPRRFEASQRCYAGEIDRADHRRIRWRSVADKPGPPRYRAAAVGVPAVDAVVFAGGSENPYNYDGVGYDGVVSQPSDAVYAFDLGSDSWRRLPSLQTPTMDHRGLVRLDGELLLIGGMRAGPEVVANLLRYRLP